MKLTKIILSALSAVALMLLIPVTDYGQLGQGGVVIPQKSTKVMTVDSGTAYFVNGLRIPNDTILPAVFPLAWRSKVGKIAIKNGVFYVNDGIGFRSATAGVSQGILDDSTFALRTWALSTFSGGSTAIYNYWGVRIHSSDSVEVDTGLVASQYDLDSTRNDIYNWISGYGYSKAQTDANINDTAQVLRGQMTHGTVTSITAKSPLTGGTITTTGNIGLPYFGVQGVYGNGTAIPQFTVDSFGLITSVTTVSVTPTTPDTSHYKNWLFDRADSNTHGNSVTYDYINTQNALNLKYSDSAAMLANYMEYSDSSNNGGYLPYYSWKQTIAYNITALDTTHYNLAYNKLINGISFDTTTGTLTAWHLDGATDYAYFDGRYAKKSITGTVTSITAGGYMSGGTVTSTGTFTPDTSAGKLATKTDLLTYYTKTISDGRYLQNVVVQ